MSFTLDQIILVIMISRLQATSECKRFPPVFTFKINKSTDKMLSNIRGKVDVINSEQNKVLTDGHTHDT